MKLRVLAAVLSGAVLIAAPLTGVPYAAQDADPYVWMEEIEGAKALDWARAENARSLPQLQKDPRFKGLYDDALKILTASDRIPSVSFAGDGTLRDFWQDASHVRGLWRSTTWRATARAVRSGRRSSTWMRSPRTRRPIGCGTARAACCPRIAGAWCELSNGGKDAASVREFDTRTGMFVKNGFAIPEAKSSYSWLDRDTLLVAHEWKKGELTESGYPFIVKTVKRGEPLSAARELFRGKVKDVAASALVLREPDGRAAGVLIVQSIDFFNSNYYVADLTRSAPQSATNPAVAKLDLPTKSTVQGYVAGRLIISLEQDWPAAGFKEGDLIDFDLAAVKANPKKLSGALVLRPTASQSIEQVATTRDRLVVALYENVKGQVVSFARTPKGWTPTQLALPKDSSIGIASASDRDNRLILYVSSYLTPNSQWLADAAAGTPQQLRSLPPRFNASTHVVEQFWATSKDSTRIPYFVIRPRDLKFDGNAPTVLYAYGGFQVSQTPATAAPSANCGWRKAASTSSPTSAAAASSVHAGITPA